MARLKKILGKNWHDHDLSKKDKLLSGIGKREALNLIKYSESSKKKLKKLRFPITERQ